MTDSLAPSPVGSRMNKSNRELRKMKRTEFHRSQKEESFKNKSKTIKIKVKSNELENLINF